MSVDLTIGGAVEPNSYGQFGRELKEARYLLDDTARKLVAAEETLSEIGDAEARVNALQREADALEMDIGEFKHVREQEQTKAAKFEFVREYVMARANTLQTGRFTNSGMTECGLAEWAKMSALLD